MRALLCGMLAVGLACGAAPPVTRLTPEQAKWLGERNALWLAGQKAWQEGKQAEAIAALEKALGVQKRLNGPLERVALIILDRLASWHQERGEWAREANYRRASLAARQALLGADHYRTIEGRLLLAEALAQSKRTPAQRAALDRAHELNDQVAALFRKGQAVKAVPLAREALAICKEVLGMNHPNTAANLNNLGSLYQEMGEYGKALPLFHEALPLLKESLGEGHPYYALNLNNLAAVYVSLGDYKAALPLYQKALAARGKALGAKHAAYADSLNNLAGLYWSMGDHKAALPLYHRAIAIYKEAAGEKSAAYANALNNLALLYRHLGDYHAALPLYRRGLRALKEALGEKHPDYALGLSGLAALHRSMGDYRAALPLFRRAIEINKEVLGERHPSHALTLTGLALLYSDLGDHRAALPLFRQALEITKQSLGERHPQYAGSLQNLADLYLSVGDQGAAAPLAEEAASLAQSQLRSGAAAQSDRQQLAAAESLRTRLETRLSLGDANCYGHLLAWKGVVLLRQRQRRLFSALSTSPKTREAAQQLQAVTRRIAALSAQARPARELLERLTEEQERLQTKLSRQSEEASAAFQAEALKPKALSRALPEGIVLVDYLFYWRHDITFRDGRRNPVRHLVAFVSRRGKPTVRADLGPAEEAQQAIGNWRAALASGRPGLLPGARVKELVWAPLEAHLKGARVVLVSPDEALAGVPFAALPGNGPGRYLVEDVALAVVPVPQLLPELLGTSGAPKRLKPSLLVVGDVDYEGAALVKADTIARGAPAGARRSWGRLPATSGEARAVSRSFARLFRGGAVTALRRDKATKAEVRRALQEVRYAHLATHGFFAPPAIKSGAGGLFGAEGVAGWHPLLLSGVVLAGANREPRQGEEDGILTALEVSEMQLPGLDLVVLSACETGLGEERGGEGMLGLQRAFAVTGARSVVASLWSVEDRATQALMAEFYKEAWNEKSVVSKAEALRRAQVALLKGTIAGGKLRGLGKKSEKLPAGEVRLPPLYWAAFVLSGDWR